MIRILIVFLFSSFVAYSQTDKFERSNDIEKDVKAILPEGQMSFDVMDQVYQSERQIELMTKFRRAIRDNYDWYVEYTQQVIEPGKPIPYHENLGLTKDEYEEFQDLIKNIKLISSGVVEYVITHGDDKITLEPLDTINNFTVNLDFSTNQTMFDNQTLTFQDTIVVDNDQNGLESKWSGYQWIFEQPTKMEMNALKDLQNFRMKQYKFTVGFLERTGKVYIQIKGREISNGVKTKDYDVPLVQK